MPLPAELYKVIIYYGISNCHRCDNVISYCEKVLCRPKKTD